MATWDLSKTEHRVLICNGSSCSQVGSEELTQAIRNEISDRDLDDIIHTTRHGVMEDAMISASSSIIRKEHGIRI
jgi:hypothetical protein